MRRWEISAVQAAMLMAGVVALTGHALAVSFFIQYGGRDAWMSGIFALPVSALTIYSLVKLGRMFPGKTIIQYLPKVLGYAGHLVAALFVFYYFMVVVFTIRMTMDWMVDTILPETPTWVMGLLYMAAVAYLALGGLDVVARANQFLLPLLSVLGLTVSFGTLQAKDYRLLTPMFEDGLGPVLLASFLGMGVFGEMSVIGMLNAYVAKKDEKKMLKAHLVGLVYEVITLTGPIAGSIATLGYRVALDMPYPTFQHWLMVTLAKFFERTDLLAVHQWLAGAYVRCGLFLLMAVTGLEQLRNSKKETPSPWRIVVAALAITLFAERAFPNKLLFDKFVVEIYLPYSAFLGTFLPPVLLLIAWIRKLGKSGQAGRAGLSHGS
ncbi:MAG TPA: endospore germination permease [Symbiobacteriaceae bacterium]|nr:endospore germination permease [Symbiobacteriaceae bacterium]